ncbi:MAG: hypothetical protein ACKPKO_23485, partial [Candidatus Fonsibacter sp.]
VGICSMMPSVVTETFADAGSVQHFLTLRTLYTASALLEVISPGALPTRQLDVKLEGLATSLARAMPDILKGSDIVFMLDAVSCPKDSWVSMWISLNRDIGDLVEAKTLSINTVTDLIEKNQ